MARVIWGRRPATIKEDAESYPPIVNQMVRDYENYLQTDAGGTNTTIEIFTDVTKKESVRSRCSYNRKAGEPRYILRTALNTPIRGGDLIQMGDDWLLLIEDVSKQINCYVTHPRKCNAFLTIQRKVDEQTDEDGYLVSGAVDQIIVEEQPCIIADNIGNMGSYGIGTWTAENPVVQMQYNAQTAAVKPNDFFDRCGERYRVLAIGHEHIDVATQAGTLIITAKKEAGYSVEG